MTLLASSTGTTHEATIYAPEQSTYTPYPVADGDFVFVVPALAVEPRNSLQELRERIARLRPLLGPTDATVAVAYAQLAVDTEYRDVRAAVRASDRAARSAQD